MVRIVYMGTPAFAVPPLQALWETGYEIVTVVTRPDRPAGRSGKPIPSAVKAFALQHDLPVWQPATLRSSEAIDYLRALAPEVIVVAAYSEILRPAVLEIPPHGCLNVHASLLPRHRGAAPIVSAILAGDVETGITLMLLDKGMDTGPILTQEAIPLIGKEHQGELAIRLSEIGASLLQRDLPAWLTGKIVPQPQEESKATYSPMLRKQDGKVDWTRPAWQIERMVRAYDPWPGTYTFLRDRRLQIWQARVLPEQSPLAPGTIVKGDQLLVVTGEETLLLEEIQLEGRRRLRAEEFLLGQRDLAGARLG